MPFKYVYPYRELFRELLIESGISPVSSLNYETAILNTTRNGHETAINKWKELMNGYPPPTEYNTVGIPTNRGSKEESSNPRPEPIKFKGSTAYANRPPTSRVDSWSWRMVFKLKGNGSQGTSISLGRLPQAKVYNRMQELHRVLDIADSTDQILVQEEEITIESAKEEDEYVHDIMAKRLLNLPSLTRLGRLIRNLQQLDLLDEDRKVQYIIEYLMHHPEATGPWGTECDKKE